jgi:hypothetical protein
MRGFLQKTFADKTLGGRLSIKSAGERDPDSEGIEGMSSSKIRQAAVNIETIGDPNYDIVEKNIQIGDVNEGFTDDIIDYIRSAYNVDPKSSWRYGDDKKFESDPSEGETEGETEGGGKKRKTRKRKVGRRRKTLKRKPKLRKTQKKKKKRKKTKNSKRR